ncbi:uncharacterized protein [Diabrotica undecimpunctata]|uniref:uncharacterized protein n=1 Tax=Diabrotica undecimpunctata TaxID=50387 RepID=UPI003B63B1EB
MNGESFEDWFKNKLIANLPKGEINVVVMDNAPYHSCKQNFPRSSWNKQQIQEWLREKNIFYEEDYLKSELLDVANSYADIYDKYNIETLVEKYGVERWFGAKLNITLQPETLKDFKKDHVQQLIHEAFANISAEQWQNYIQHVIRIQKEMWIADNLQEDNLPVIITANTGSSSEDDFSEIE